LFADGDWIESKDQSANGVRLVQTGNVGGGTFKDRAEKARYISVATFDRLRCTEVREGDCLVSRLPDPVGRSCILPDTGEQMITAVDCTILRFKPNSVLSSFFNFYSQSGTYLKAVSSATTGTTRNRISRSNLGLVHVPVPPLAEQRRIVAILDEVFDGIATANTSAEGNRQNARELFESYARNIFLQGAERWPVKTIDRISTNLDSKRIPITKSDRKAGEFPYYGASGIVDYVAEYIFEGDSLLISEDGANLLARSTPIAFSASGLYWVNNHAHILKFDHMETQRFVEFFLESIPLDEYITGAAQPKLNQKALNSIPIPIPDSVDEQAKIVDCLEKVAEQSEQLREVYERKLIAIDELKQSLLHQAFSGAL
jgi:type I restriction enzyme S subunit